jgi:ATP-dependent Lon protease
MADLDTPTLDGQALPLLPLAAGVVLPQTVVTLALESDEAQAAATAATAGDGLVLLVPRVEGRYARVGTVARVEDSGALPNGTGAVILRGLHRAVLGAGVAGTGPGLWVRAETVDEPPASDAARASARELRSVLTVLAERRGSRRLPELLRTADTPGALADGFGAWSDMSNDRKLELLETVELESRLEKALAWAREALAEQEVTDKIRSEVNDGLEKTQREFVLRQQLAAIKKELGEGDDDDVVEQYRTRIAEGALPDAVREAATREVDRLERMSEQSPEHGWIRTWLDTLLDVPWGEAPTDRLDVGDARRILDEDHTGLDDVKDRIVEYLAVRKLRAERGLVDAGGRGSGAIIALVGPPGVGKTSLGESVARAMGRKFVRVALGGVRDEAEIRGHRRTYVGARPGRIVRAITEAGTMNPVVLLDEVDKLSAGAFSGDPSSALLEVLDPAQNHTFRDHYLEVDLDLSQVLFLATANVAEAIPGPLLDRMELVRLDGYTEEEKVAIARDHLLERQRDRCGLGADEVEISDDALRAIVTDYTREAGVRNLERELGKLLRKVAAGVAGGERTPPVEVGTDDVRTLLGRAKFFAEAAERTSVPGVATGLAVTGTGGDVLFIEASPIDGEPGITLTGQLGDVMKESARIALSYVQAHRDELGLADDGTGRRFHLHVPAGAVPKDGPSAGITMTTALASLLADRPVRADVGMTGEVTLQGRVLPIGGVKQKVLAAQRAGLTTVILPARNGPDLDDVPEAVRDALTFHLVDDVQQVLELALEPIEQAQQAA